MKFFAAIALFCFSLYGQNGTFTLTEASNGSLTVFSISPNYRGADLIAMFNILNTAPYKISGQSQIAVQTTNNGLITNIQAITPMKNYTILLFTYLLPSNSLPLGHVGKDSKQVSYGFVSIPVEQITEMVYSPTIMNVAQVFTSKPPSGVLPLYSIDLKQRAEDIQEAVGLMITPPIATGNNLVSPVSLSTTLSGPYYSGTANSSGTPIIINGIIPQVQSITTTGIPNKTLLIVTFKPLQSNPYLTKSGTASIVVAPDQINGIIFTQ